MEAYIGLRLYRQSHDYRIKVATYKEYEVIEVSRKFATVRLVGAEVNTDNKILKTANPNGTFANDGKHDTFIYHTRETLLRQLRIDKAQSLLKDVTGWQYNAWQVGAYEKLLRKLSEALEALTDSTLITEDLIWQNPYSIEKSQTSGDKTQTSA